MKPVIKFVIADTHMGLGHDGLESIIQENKKRNALFKSTLKNGGLVLFINKRKTAMKLYQPGGEVIGYFRSRGGRITERSIDAIPATFGGSVDHAAAVKSALKRLIESDTGKRTLSSSARLVG